MLKSIKTILVFGSILVFYIACSKSNQSGITNQPNAQSAAQSNSSVENQTNSSSSTNSATGDLAQGQEIYALTCAKCHQPDGTGGNQQISGKDLHVADLTTERRKSESDAMLQQDIEEGDPEEGMPAFKGKLSEQEMKDLILYIRKGLQKSS